jgi:alanine-glyoxylate transaminase/serine-glyoxylate transaminase/serine-pyruvate transaminase
MTSTRPLLMIPGPIEVSPAVLEAFCVPPPGHLAPRVIEAFGASLGLMREVWRAAADAQPFVVPGSGTTAMEMAAANLVQRGDTVLVVKTGYFSDRMEEMLRRLGAEVLVAAADPGAAPAIEVVESLFDGAQRSGKPVKVLFATHVDTSTGVLIDPAPLAARARQCGAMSVFDGVCATAAERFEMGAWDADVYLTASQKAIGLPPGLGLLVASARALEARRSRRDPAPPMGIDFHEWLPVMKAYEERKPAYFATPPTNLVLALDVGLREILAAGMDARFELHREAADTMRAAWRRLGLRPVPVRPDLQANTLSALYFPEGVDVSFVGRVAARGVTVAGGLHPALRTKYFRVGHMGYAATRPDMLERTIAAIAAEL